MLACADSVCSPHSGGFGFHPLQDTGRCALLFVKDSKKPPEEYSRHKSVSLHEVADRNGE